MRFSSPFDLDHPWAILPQAIDGLRAKAAAFTPADRARYDAAVASGQIVAGRPNYQVERGVAVVSISGPIFHRDALAAWLYDGTTSEQIIADVQAAVADPRSSAVVLNIDSPGGEVAGTPEAAAAIMGLRSAGKPIVGVANSLCASAAYWIGSAAHTLFAMASATVGSVGVIQMLADCTGALAKNGVKVNVLRSGQFKALGMPYEELSSDARTVLQAKLDYLYGEFVAGVASTRGLDPAQATTWAEGQVFFGAQAQAQGLIDGVATLHQVISELAAGSGPPSSRAARGSLMADTTLTAPAVDAALTQPAVAANTPSAPVAAPVSPLADATTPPVSPPAAVAPALDPQAVIAAERKRGQDIRALCTAAGLPDQATALIDNGATVEEARAKLFDAMCRTRQLVGDNGATIAGENQDPYAAYRAEYRQHRAVHESIGTSEDEYVRSRCITDKKPLPKAA